MKLHLTVGDGVVALLLVAATAASFFFFRSGDARGDRAVVERDGRIVGIISLRDDKYLEVQGRVGLVHVDVRNGAVAITGSACPNHLCIREGWHSRRGEVIVCVPNGIVVRVEGSASQPAGPIVRSTVAMDTYVKITVYDEKKGRENTDLAVDAAFAEIRRIEEFATDYDDSSEVGRINAYADIHPVKASQELIGLLLRSRQFHAMSDGAFDVTVGPMVKAWNFKSDSPQVPSDRALRALVPLVGDRLIRIGGDSVYLPFRKMAIDLGAIGKGYAARRASEILSMQGFRHFIVDIGGNLSIVDIDSMATASVPTSVDVRDPRHPERTIGQIAVRSGGVSTSGDYERCFFINGIRYHHLLDPATGRPARDLISVTIVTNDAESADALSTAVFVLGRKKGAELLGKIPGVQGLLMWEANGAVCWTTTGGLVFKERKEASGLQP